MSKTKVNVVKDSVDEAILKKQYGDTIDYNYTDKNQFAGSDRNATNQMYQSYLKGQGINPMDTSFDLNSVSGNTVNSNQSAQQVPSRYNSQDDMNNIEGFLGNMSDSYVKGQQASLESAKNQKIAELQKAYEDAVADGKISIRDAQDSFATQKDAIEQQAYVDSQALNLAAQNRGIQNSQQMLGLAQGDNARKMSLLNTNMTTRDKRIADIKDRLNALSKQKALDISTANSEYNTGMQKAQSEADMMVAQNMYNMLNENMQANRQQQFTQDNMATQQGYTQQNMATQQGYDMQKLAQDNTYKIQQMNLGHEFDMEKMDKELSNSIALANLNYSHQSALQGQAAAQRAAEAKQVAMDKIAAAQQEYQLALQREYNRYNNPDSAEFKIRAAQIEEARDQKIADAFTSAQVQAVAQGTTNDPALGYDVTEAPTDYTQSYGNGFVGNLFNLFTNYNTKASQWDAKQQAQTAKDAFLSNPVDYYNTYLKKGSGVSDVYENANIPVSDYQTLDDLFQD